MKRIAVALLVVATACQDAQAPLAPKLEAWGVPSPQNGQLTGVGSIGSAPDVQFFGFDVKSQQMRITGLFLGAEPSSDATLITDPPGDPATSFTAFRASSSFCSDPSHGAEFDAVGHLVEPSNNVDVYVEYTIKGCDNGSPILRLDTWSVDIPSRGYHKDGAVSGDIIKQ
jgi:hypothetical protein